jgi:ribosomal protein S18 acetylase RimI-like enzyme
MRRSLAGMAVEVRPVRPDEYEQAGRVTADAYREFADSDSWEEYLRTLADVEGRAQRATVLVAVEDGRVLGTLTLELDQRIDPDDPPLPSGEAHIRMLGVAPDARGRGVARALMDASVELARQGGRTLISLHTTQRMRAAQAMYDSLGFERGPDRVFPDGFVLLSYMKTVPPA